MSKERIVRYKKGMKDRTDWARVNAMTDEDIDYSDCPPLDEEFFATAKPIPIELKAALQGVSFDPDVIAWFKKQGPDCQIRMNAVLRTYMNRQKSVTQRSTASRKPKLRKAAG